eukprot:4347031-Alexandrium_andersonii.AAC.1
MREPAPRLRLRRPVSLVRLVPVLALLHRQEAARALDSLQVVPRRHVAHVGSLDVLIDIVLGVGAAERGRAVIHVGVGVLLRTIGAGNVG